jgi:hypothetical protein
MSATGGEFIFAATAAEKEKMASMYIGITPSFEGPRASELVAFTMVARPTKLRKMEERNSFIFIYRAVSPEKCLHRIACLLRGANCALLVFLFFA